MKTQTLLATLFLFCFICCSAIVLAGGGHRPKPPKPKPSPSPTPSPLPSFGGGISTGSSIDIYVPTSASCLNAFATVTTFTFQTGNLSEHRTCRSLILCMIRWLEQLLQLILSGLTPGASFSNSIATPVSELNTAFSHVNAVLGGVLSETGTSVNPPSTGACPFIFAPVLAANGQIYASSCVAAAASAPNPYVNVTINPTRDTGAGGSYTAADITNPRVAFVVLYIKYAIKIMGFVQTYLNECILSTENRVFTDGISSLNRAIELVWNTDYNAAKALVLNLSQNI